MLRERRRHASFKPNRKLDRKSSRGMIYENEELRLRTININAEVERGQSDIKKLRRENDQLRKEIWSLRDEYDRLDKLLRAHKTSAANKRSSRRGDDYDEESEDDDDDDDDEDDEDDKCNSCNQSEDSYDSCQKLTDESNENQQNARITRSASGSNKGHNHHHHDNAARQQTATNEQTPRDQLHVNFDHLSIVSEETALSYSDEDNATMEYNKSYRPKSPGAGDRSPAVLYDFQSIVPALSHFENLCYEKIGPSIDETGQLKYPDEYSPGPTTSSTGDTVIPAIGWDFSKLPSSPANTLHSVKTSISSLNDRGPPDICIQNVSASEPHETSKVSRIYSPSIFPTGGNLDDLLLDIAHITKDLNQMQIDNSRKQQPSDLDELANDDWGNCTNTKPPYRSEMNLVLTFDGTSNTITSVTTAEDPPPPISDPNSSTPPPPPNTPSPNISHQDSPPPVIPAPMLLLPDTLPYVEFQDTRQTVPDPPSALPPTGPSSQGRKSSNFATIRKRFFTRKSSVSNDSSDAKPVSEVNSSSSDAGVCILLSNGEVHEESAPSDQPTTNKPTTSKDLSVPTSSKRKSRRVSIDFNNGNFRKSAKESSDGRRGSTASCFDIDEFSTNKTNGTSNKKSGGGLSRKMSQGSNRPSRSKKKHSGRRHSDGGTGGAVTDGSERTSNSVASSRESSTSRSTRSQKSARKISVGSHGNGSGSIPWCACWGNGCI